MLIKYRFESSQFPQHSEMQLAFGACAYFSVTHMGLWFSLAVHGWFRSGLYSFFFFFFFYIHITE